MKSDASDYVTAAKCETNQTTYYTFKQEYVPVSSDGFDRCFLGLEGLPIINGSYTSPNEARNLALIIPFRDGPEKIREKQLYVFLHHTLQYLVQQNSSFTIILSNQSGKANVDVFTSCCKSHKSLKSGQKL